MPELIKGVECWSAEDRNEGRCHPRVLWQPVANGDGFTVPTVEEPEPEPEEVPQPVLPPSSLAAVPAERLKDDVMAAYTAAGGVAYLQRLASTDPVQFMKLLTRILPQTMDATIRASVSLQPSAADEQLFAVRRQHGLCQAYPWATVLPDGCRVVEVGQLSPNHLRLIQGQVQLPEVPGQHFVVFRKEGDEWLPVESRDATYTLIKEFKNVA